MEQIIDILAFIFKSFLHIWPYLLITIPLAVIINLSGAAKYITKAFNAKPLLSILLATAVGAISPFCSCGVIPVITSLLIGGVPLGPVMSFWIASPSMDPEIFILSVASIGWELSVWRLAATFIISISAGIITHIAQVKGFFGTSVLRNNRKEGEEIGITKSVPVALSMVQVGQSGTRTVNCCIAEGDTLIGTRRSVSCECTENSVKPKLNLYNRILAESWKSFLMVAKFMSIAFLINALIHFYLPGDILSGFMATDSPWSVLIATMVGIPFYTTNLTALPLVSGMITLGMNQGAALAFLIAGPLTTLPAMMAVMGIVKRKVFILFLSFGLLGSLLFGYLYNLVY